MIACVRPGDADRDRPGSVVLLSGAGGPLASFGPIRDRSAGVSLDAHEGRVVVGYRDADALASRAMIAELSGEEAGEPSAVSQVETSASAPSVRFVDGALHFAWTEAWYEGGEIPTGHLLVQREGEPPRPSLSVSDVNVRTYLDVDGERPMVTLRDARPRGARHRSFTGHLDDALRLDEDRLHSPSRADAQDGQPQVLRCGDHRFSVATRRSSREVTMVTIRRLAPDLDRAEDEHQIYEYHRRFPQAVGACVDGHLLVLVGERETDHQPRPRLSTYTLICEPGREHARTPG